MLLDYESAACEAGTDDLAIPAPSASGALDTLTLHVIVLSMRDTLRSASSPTYCGRLIARLFGFDQPVPLANARLEAVRCFCIFVRFADVRADAMRGELGMLGYSNPQCEAIEGALESLVISNQTIASTPSSR